MTILFYGCIEILSIYLFLLANKKKKHLVRKRYTSIVWLILFIVITFRDITVGRDYESYYYAIIRVAEGNMRDYDYTWLSSGFRILIKIIALFGFPVDVIPIIISGIIAGITLYFFLEAINEFSIDSTLSLFIMFCFCYFFQMMNQFRQMCAVSLALYSFKFIDRSFVKYCLAILVAGLLHSSALVLIPMYFITKLKISHKLLTVYFIIGLSMIFLWPCARQLIAYTPYSYYLGWNEYDVSLTKSSYLNLFVRLIMLCFCLIFRKRVIENYKKNEVLYHYVVICTILQIVTLHIQLFSRITTYFYVFYILLLPEVFTVLLRKFNINSKKIVKGIIYTFLTIYQVVYFQVQGAVSLYDVYKSMLF